MNANNNLIDNDSNSAIYTMPTITSFLSIPVYSSPDICAII